MPAPTAPSLGPVTAGAPARTARARLTVPTPGRGFTDLTPGLKAFLREAAILEGQVTAFVRHTSASLLVTENASPEVRADLDDAFDRLAPRAHPWRHADEGPDDMPAHLRAALTLVSVTLPVSGGRPGLGTWQGLYLFEHRDRPHRREVDLLALGD